MWTVDASSKQKRSLPILFRDKLLSNNSSLNKRFGTLEMYLLQIKKIESPLENIVSPQIPFRFFGRDYLTLTDQLALPPLIRRGVFALMHEIAGDPLHGDV